MEALVQRVRGEFREMPGLRLTFAQACRLWQIDTATCRLVPSLYPSVPLRNRPPLVVGITAGPAGAAPVVSRPVLAARDARFSRWR